MTQVINSETKDHLRPGQASGTLLRAWQTRVFSLLWGAYASYYLCRVNFAAAQPLILMEFPTWTAGQIGAIPSSFALAYATGQVVNGVLGQRYGARRMMTLALLIAAASNILISFSTSFFSMQVLWAINGWGQSAGWALMVQTLSDWNTSTRRGTLIGKLSTCYQVGHVLSWLLAGQLCDTLGWRAAFLVPGMILLPVAAVFYLLLRDSPSHAGLPPVRDDVVRAPGLAETSARVTWQIVKLTLANRVIWVLAIAFFVMNAVRYTFMNWSVHYMVDFHGRGIRASVLTAIVIPLAGASGALAAGWLSDSFFQRRRAPICVLMLMGVSATCAGIALVPRGDWLAAAVLLAIAGFTIYGPDVLVAGAATVDLSHPKAGAIATGFTMCVGGLGTVFSGAGVGYLKDFGGDWPHVFGVLAGLALLPCTLLISLWNVKPKASPIQ